MRLTAKRKTEVFCFILVVFNCQAFRASIPSPDHVHVCARQGGVMPECPTCSQRLSHVRMTGSSSLRRPRAASICSPVEPRARSSVDTAATCRILPAGLPRFQRAGGYRADAKRGASPASSVTWCASSSPPHHFPFPK